MANRSTLAYEPHRSFCCRSCCKVHVKVGFFYSAACAAMPRPAALYNHRKWQLIGKSQWCGSAMLQLQHTPPLQSSTPGLHPVSIHQMAPPVRESKYPITAYYSVYRPRKDERLSRPGWLVTCRQKCRLLESNPDTSPIPVLIGLDVE